MQIKQETSQGLEGKNIHAGWFNRINAYLEVDKNYLNTLSEEDVEGFIYLKGHIQRDGKKAYSLTTGEFFESYGLFEACGTLAEAVRLYAVRKRKYDSHIIVMVSPNEESLVDDPYIVVSRDAPYIDPIVNYNKYLG